MTVETENCRTTNKSHWSFRSHSFYS